MGLSACLFSHLCGTAESKRRVCSHASTVRLERAAVSEAEPMPWPLGFL